MSAMIASLIANPVVYIIGATVAVVLLAVIILDAHKRKKERHRGRWK